MSRNDDPLDKLGKLWAEGAQGYAAAMQSFAEALEGRLGGQAGAATDPTAWAQSWGRAAGELGGVIGQLIDSIARDLPQAAGERLQRQSFGQLGRAASQRVEDEVGRLESLPAELAERLGALGRREPERLSRLLESMVDEYLQDLRTLADDAFRIEVGPLAQAFAQVLAGEDDPAARKVVDRFVAALAVKARYGAEYYADPERTLVGQTPRELIHRQGRLALYRYRAPAGTRPADAPPLLLVYSVINKPYILDLVPGFSFVEHLLAAGLDVYLIDWGESAPGDRRTALDDYIEPGLSGCVEQIRRRTGADKVSLFGHCIGGNLALLYAALHPERVDRMVTLTTPATAAEGGVVAVWTDRELFPIDDIIEQFGHMPAKLIRYTFMVLKPYYEVLKWKMFLENLGDDRVMGLFLPVDRWANENVDIPGEVFRKFIREVFHEGGFSGAGVAIHGRSARLADVRCPLLNLAAERDWIVPLESARVLNERVGSAQTEFVPIEGAHVSIMIDPRARVHWTTMSKFLGGRDQTAGEKPTRRPSRQKASAKTSQKRPQKARKKAAKKPGKKTARKPAEKAAEKPGKKTAEKTAKKTAKKTGKKGAKKTAEKASRKTPAKSSKKGSAKSARKSPKRAAKKSTKKSTGSKPARKPKKK